MIDLITITYLAIVWVVFKVFKVPVNKWTITTSILVGFLGISLVILVMNYHHPYSKEARMYFYTTPIVPNVAGEVIEVPVKPNESLNEGDVLFRIDPTPFEERVAEVSAELTLAREDLADAKQLVKKGAARQRAVDQATATVDALIAQLGQAQYDLKETVVRAPTKGYVTHQRLRPGMRAVPMPLRPVMTFIHDEGEVFVAAFTQNPLQVIKPGAEAEVVFDSIPGHVFAAKVGGIIDVIALGQIQPSGDLIDLDSARLKQQGRVPVFIEITDDLSEYQLVGGVKGEVAVYSDKWKMFDIIRRVLLRMKAWQKYLFWE